MPSFAYLAGWLTWKVQWQWFTIFRCNYSRCLTHYNRNRAIFAVISRPNVIQYAYKFPITNIFVIKRKESLLFLYVYVATYVLSRLECLRCRSLDVIWCVVTDAHNSWYRCFPIRSISMGLHTSVYMQIDLRQVDFLPLLLFVSILCVWLAFDKWGLNYTIRTMSNFFFAHSKIFANTINTRNSFTILNSTV